MKLSRQTQKVFERMQELGTYSQERAFEERTTFRLSNKVRELEAKGFTIGRARVSEGRSDFKYWIEDVPEELKVERKQESLGIT